MAGKDDPMEVEQCTEAVDQVASIPDDVIIRILSSLKVGRYQLSVSTFCPSIKIML
jgi:hypothetical protein